MVEKEVIVRRLTLLEKQAVNLKKMAQFRNVLVHDYTKIEPEIVYSILQKHLVDILDYAQMIKEHFYCDD